MSNSLSQELLASDLREVVTLLERYVSPLNVRGMLGRALRESNVAAERFRRSDLPKITPNLQRGLGLFLSGTERAQALRELSDLCERNAAHSPQAPSRMSITSEADISTVRNEARRMCELAATNSFIRQKVTTIASELARNIVSYATRGELEISLQQGRGRRISIVASDQGPGIPNLDVIMSGRYRSKTGLGRGLLGTKQLADDFNIDTGASGTTIRVEVAL